MVFHITARAIYHSHNSSAEKWNDTGIQLIAGQEYQFTVGDNWVDWFIIKCNTDGFPGRYLVLRITEKQWRVQGENWFAVMGALDFDKNSIFKIDSGRTLVMTRSGTLTCYANDV